MRTIEWVEGEVQIIDQRLLPHELRVLHLRTVDELVTAVRSLAVRGAMALGVAGAMGVALAAVRAEEAHAEVVEACDRAGAALDGARPTAVNLSWGVRRAQLRAREGAAAVVSEALAIRDQDIATNRRIGELGASLLVGVTRLLTHCNAGALAGVEYGSALSIIRNLHESGEVDHVLVGETRPLLQGSRLTAWELGQLGIPFSVMVDSAAAGLLARKEAGAVIVGADRIAANGDVANKVGTLGLALAARSAEVPFIVAAPESTVDYQTQSGDGIKIEERNPDEVLEFAGRRVAPEGAAAVNPAFDVTPAHLVTAIVTESRIIRAAAGERPVDSPTAAASTGISGTA